MAICAVGENGILISQWKPKYNMCCASFLQSY